MNLCGGGLVAKLFPTFVTPWLISQEQVQKDVECSSVLSFIVSKPVNPEVCILSLSIIF